MCNIENLKNMSKYLNQFADKVEHGMRFSEKMPRVIAGDDKEYTSSLSDFFGNVIDTYVKNDELFMKVNGWKRGSDDDKEIRIYRFTFKQIVIYEENQYTISELRDNTKGNMCKSSMNHIEILIKGGRRFYIYS
ncbi:hypothetical protein [Paraclostridium sordellii]|uniref:hypothetical protein n=1 Tax=Paraclostridium sordellii TaxID=1505 RepID=UPI0005E63F60|nr:hypothetical protein [Paeniclostridium sordellii]CEN94328.1 Uncharacterised protein [[Clostridium] sordellii] [Paeniclostridium sordellii]CEN94649.1 Uncharacterised protein [[Clostridium] sordellii] [Paeniclostridium sordellii]